MKRHLISSVILILLILSIIGVLYALIRENLRTPHSYWELAQTQLADKNYVAAVRNLTKAADGQIPDAQYQLALLYDAGDKIPENREKAIFYMKAAAQLNYRDALYVMGVWTERGYFDAPNTQQAIQYYESAAQSGHINAMKTLIVLYDNLNPTRQQFWYQQLIQKEKIK